MRLIGQGRSNLTFQVDSSAGSVVLRRPPTGALAATAHDMGREARVISALSASPVPVPDVLAVSAGGEPVDAPCFVMERLDGVVPLGELPAGWAPEPADRRRAGLALVDVLVELHQIDPSAVGLADFGRPDGFLARQVRRWTKQWEAWRQEWAAGAPDPSVAARLATEVGALATRLGSTVPDPQRSGIVHGDYRIDNLLFDGTDPGRVLGVLDWEMSTLGDQLTDLGLLMIYWCQADDPVIWREAQVLPGPTRLAGFPSRTELAARYADRTGADLSGLDWYTAFGAFKLAVVVAGILARVRAGVVPVEMAHGLSDGVRPLVVLGHHLLDEGPSRGPTGITR